MAISLQSLLELPPTIGAPVQLFGDDKFLTDNTMLSKRAGARTERCKTAFRYDKETYLRALAPITGRGARSITVLGQTPSVIQIGGAFIRINMPFTGEMLHSVRNPGDISSNAAATIQKARRSMRQRIRLTKELLWANALAGTTTINSTLFPDGTVDGVSVDWGFGTFAESASWDAIATRIVSADCESMHAQMVDASGRRVGEIIFNESVAKMLKKNTEILDYVRALALSEAIAKSKGAEAFAGIGSIPKWTEYLGSYQPEGGSVTRFVANNAVLILPEAWEELVVEARYAMDRPASGMLVAAADAGMIPDEVYGDEDGIDEYVYQTPDPAGLVLVAQAGIQPIIKLPEAFLKDASVIA